MTAKSLIMAFSSLIGVAGGCADAMKSGDSRPAGIAAGAPKADAPAAGGKKAAQAGPADRRIIYDGRVTVLVTDFEAARGRLVAYVSEHGGWVASAEVKALARSRRRAEIKLRVPNRHFNELMELAASQGEELSRRIDSEDVTEEYVDLEARIKNKRVQEGRLLELMEKSAGSVKDLADLEMKIAEVRGEIERMQGRLNYLTQMTDMATVTVELTEDEDYVPPAAPTYGEEVGGTFRRSLAGLTEFLRNASLVAVALVPWLPVLLLAGAALWLPVRRYRRRAKRA